MFVVVWQFEIAEENVAAFEAAYGPRGRMGPTLPLISPTISAPNSSRRLHPRQLPHHRPLGQRRRLPRLSQRSRRRIRNPRPRLRRPHQPRNPHRRLHPLGPIRIARPRKRLIDKVFSGVPPPLKPCPVASGCAQPVPYQAPESFSVRAPGFLKYTCASPIRAPNPSCHSRPQAKPVPDRFALAVFLGRALDLHAGACRSKQKIRRKRLQIPIRSSLSRVLPVAAVCQPGNALHPCACCRRGGSQHGIAHKLAAVHHGKNPSRQSYTTESPQPCPAAAPWDGRFRIAHLPPHLKPLFSAISPPLGVSDVGILEYSPFLRYYFLPFSLSALLQSLRNLIQAAAPFPVRNMEPRRSNIFEEPSPWQSPMTAAKP